MTVLLLSSLIFSFITITSAANILACLPTPSYSHQIAYREVWNELSLRGHKVTLITTDPVNNLKLTNLTEIDTHFSYEVFQNVSDMAENDSGWWDFQKTFRTKFKRLADAQLAHEEVQDLIHNRNRKFDLVLSEFLFPEFLAFAEIYKTPKIIFSSLDASVVFHNAIGNTIHPALYPDIIAPFYAPLTFWERVKNTLYTYHVLDYIHHYTYSDKDETIRTFFNSSTTTYELISDTDLLLLNINPVINGIRAVGPTTITIGDLSRVHSSVPLTKGDMETALVWSQTHTITTDPANDQKLVNLTEMDAFSYTFFKNVSSIAESDSGCRDFRKTFRPFFKGAAIAQLAHEEVQGLIHNRSHSTWYFLNSSFLSSWLSRKYTRHLK